MTQPQHPSTARRDPEAERALIGCLFWNQEASPVDMVPEWFTNQSWRLACAAIKSLKQRGEAVDPLTVKAEAEKTQTIPITTLTDWTGCYDAAYNVFNWETYAAIVRREYQLRQTIEASVSYIQKAIAFQGDDPATLVQGMISNLVEIGTAQRSQRRFDLQDGLAELKALVRQIKSGEQRKGFDFVLPSMRKACFGGLAYPGSINLIGANPGVGKSMLLLTMAVWNATLRDQKGIYIGTEMPIEILMIRIAPMLAHILGIEGVTPESIEKGECEAALDVLSEVVDQRKLRENLIMFDSITAVESYLATLAAEGATEKEIDFVVVDYIQMLSPEDSTRFKNSWSAAEYVCEAIRASAVRGNFTLVAASSFTKGGKTDKPTDERFRGVFKLAHDAGTMWGIWESEDMGGQLCIRLIKNRVPSSSYNGLDVDIPITFDSSGMIKELTIETQPIIL